MFQHVRRAEAELRAAMHASSTLAISDGIGRVHQAVRRFRYGPLESRAIQELGEPAYNITNGLNWNRDDDTYVGARPEEAA